MSGSARTSDSRASAVPQVISSCAHASWARAFVCSSFAFVHARRLTSTYSGSDKTVGKPERDLARRRLGGVRSVHEVVRHRRREVAANRPRLRIRRVRPADRLPRRRDDALAFEHERERRPRGDELDELAEERLLPVLGVVLLREVAVDLQQACGPQPEAALLEATEDLTRERAAD